jgi:pre-rRNA-processing protein RIX1
MSLPPELGAVCFQLQNTPSTALLCSLPGLQRQLRRCHLPLSSSAGKSTQVDAPTTVLVHKLKTMLSTFLNSRSSEERFISVVLIKTVVEVGGWEVLRGSEPWVRGLLSLLTVSLNYCDLHFTH